MHIHGGKYVREKKTEGLHIHFSIWTEYDKINTKDIFMYVHMVFVVGLIMKNAQKISMMHFERENKMLFIRNVNIIMIIIMVNEGRKSDVSLMINFQQIYFISYAYALQKLPWKIHAFILIYF